MKRLMLALVLLPCMAQAEVVKTIKNGQVVYESVPSNRTLTAMGIAKPSSPQAAPAANTPMPYSASGRFATLPVKRPFPDQSDIAHRAGTVPCANGFGSRPVGKIVPGC